MRPEARGTPLRHFTYANVMSTLAVFLVIAGGVALAARLPRASVGSPAVKDNSLRSKDLKNGHAVAGADVIDGSLDQTDLANGAIGSAEVADDSLTGADISENSLGSVPSATLGGMARGGPVEDTCNPAGAGFVPCASVNLTIPPGQGGNALVLGIVQAKLEAGSDAAGFCQLGLDLAGPVPDSKTPQINVSTGLRTTMVTLTGVTPLLIPGTHTLSVDCNQGDGSIDYDSASVKVLAVSPS